MQKSIFRTAFSVDVNTSIVAACSLRSVRDAVRLKNLRERRHRLRNSYTKSFGPSRRVGSIPINLLHLASDLISNFWYISCPKCWNVKCSGDKPRCELNYLVLGAGKWGEAMKEIASIQVRHLSSHTPPDSSI